MAIIYGKLFSPTKLDKCLFYIHDRVSSFCICILSTTKGKIWMIEDVNVIGAAQSLLKSDDQSNKKLQFYVVLGIGVMT